MDLEALYKKYGALLEGHFLLSSGLHSKYYLQSARVLEYPDVAEELAKELAKKIKQREIEFSLVASPALGGLIIGYELARALGVRFVFTERKNGIMQLRRGFRVEKEKVIICEDIITTGGSAKECASEIEKNGGEVVAFCSIAKRGKETNFNKPFFYLDEFNFKAYKKEECPLCKEGIELIKPGSRGNQ